MPDSKGNIGCLNDLPRARLVRRHTPLEPMENLSKAVGGGSLYVKRDDLSGLAFGGNKVRQLEFYLGEALAEGADTIMMTGAVQSNFVRTAAAACRKLGLDCHIQLEERVAKNDPEYRKNGNVLLNHLFGAILHSYSQGEDEAGADRNLVEIAERLKDTGHHPYIVHMLPDHKPLGALGYVVAAQELLQQIDETGITVDEIVVASGSGNTHAGLLFGLRALGSDIRVFGVCVRRNVERQYPRMQTRLKQIAELLDMESKVTDDDIHLIDDYFAPGYGLANQDVFAAIFLGAQYEALVLDPCYMGKTMAGMLERAVAGKADKKNVLMIHTGGTPAIFAYGQEIREEVQNLKGQLDHNRWGVRKST